MGTLEEEVRVVLEDWSQVKLDIAYKYLQARGCRSEALDARIQAGLRAEIKEGNER